MREIRISTFYIDTYMAYMTRNSVLEDCKTFQRQRQNLASWLNHDENGSTPEKNFY